MAVISALSVAPFAWILAAVPLLHPGCQDWLIRAFSDPGQSTDPLLENTLKQMFQVNVIADLLWMVACDLLGMVACDSGSSRTGKTKSSTPE